MLCFSVKWLEWKRIVFLPWQPHFVFILGIKMMPTFSRQAFNYLQNFSATLPTLTAAVTLMRLLVVVAEKSDSGEISTKIGKYMTHSFNTSRPEQNGCYLANDILKWIYLKKLFLIFIQVCFFGFRHHVSIVSGKSLLLHRWQAITWIIDDQIQVPVAQGWLLPTCIGQHWPHFCAVLAVAFSGKYFLIIHYTFFLLQVI